MLDDAVVETAAYVIERESTARDVICYSLLKRRDKGKHLGKMIRDSRDGSEVPGIYLTRTEDLRTLPGKVIAYWLPVPFIHALQRIPTAEDLGIEVYSGLQTDDDFRFLRLWWEVPTDSVGSSQWRTFAKGGDYAPYADDYDLLVNWKDDGQEMKSFVEAKYVNWSRHIKNTDRYAIYGLTYTERTTSDISIRAFPEDSIFSVSGPVIQCKDREKLILFWAVATSRVGKALIEIEVGSGDTSRAGTAARHYRTGILKNVRLPTLAADNLNLITRSVIALYDANLSIRSEKETHRLFAGVPPSLLRDPAEHERHRLERKTTLFVKAAEAAQVIDRAVLNAFNLPPTEARAIAEALPCDGTQNGQELSEEIARFLVSSDDQQQIAMSSGRAGRAATKLSHFFSRPLELAAVTFDADIDTVAQAFKQSHDLGQRQQQSRVLEVASMLFGLVFGRWTLKRYEKGGGDPWSRLPSAPPGANSGLPVADALLCDDPGHRSDWETRLRKLEEGEQVVLGQPVSALLRNGQLRTFLAQGFFQQHIAEYSSSRRKAPIYWQLATFSANYSVWLYYHRITRDTLYRVLSDYIAPKLKHEDRRLSGLVQEAGPNPSAGQRKDLGAQGNVVLELRAFYEEVARVAPLWSPNLNDGVIINFAPLWRLVAQNRSWQKECKKVWDRLVAGDYDWAHLAMHLWPERVVPKCTKDRSLSIAHGLEDVFWYEDSEGKWQPRKVGQTEVDKLVKERISAAVKDALKSLHEAPAPATGRSNRRKAPQARGTRKKTASTRPKVATNGASSSSRAAATVDVDPLSKVKEAIGAKGDGASKADIIDTTRITVSEWNKAIKALLADGSVTQTGERRGARYHLAGGDA